MNTNVLRLLLVDDDSDDRLLFIEAAKQIDDSIECTVAVNGLHAIEILKVMPVLPDFIFLDIYMPEFNGKKCLAELKRNEQFKSIPVIIYTGSTNVQASKELKQMGANYFISKPGNAVEIYYLISFVIEQQAMRLPEDRFSIS